MFVTFASQLFVIAAHDSPSLPAGLSTQIGARNKLQYSEPRCIFEERIVGWRAYINPCMRVGGELLLIIVSKIIRR